MNPSFMQKQEPISGTLVKLCDGNYWLFPAVINLPYDYQLGQNGTILKKPVERYSKFFKVASEIYQLFACLTNEAVTAQDVPVSETIDFVCEAISINYDVSKSEILRNELLDEDSLMAALLAIVSGGVRDEIGAHEVLTVPLEAVL